MKNEKRQSANDKYSWARTTTCMINLKKNSRYPLSAAAAAASSSRGCSQCQSVGFTMEKTTWLGHGAHIESVDPFIHYLSGCISCRCLTCLCHAMLMFVFVFLSRHHQKCVLIIPDAEGARALRQKRQQEASRKARASARGKKKNAPPVQESSSSSEEEEEEEADSSSDEE